MGALSECSRAGGGGDVAGDGECGADLSRESLRSTERSADCGQTLAAAPGFPEHGAVGAPRSIAAHVAPHTGAAQSRSARPAQAASNVPEQANPCSTPRPRAQKGGPNPFACRDA